MRDLEYREREREENKDRLELEKRAYGRGADFRATAMFEKSQAGVLSFSFLSMFGCCNFFGRWNLSPSTIVVVSLR